MLTIYTSASPISLASIRSFIQDSKLTDSLDLNWNNQPPPNPVEYSILCDTTDLFIIAKRDKTPQMHETASAGDFQPGLWRHDVFELFLSNEGTSTYQEFNLAPNGAWWTSVFDSPRCTKGEYSPPKCIQTLAEPTDKGWWAALQFPTRSLGITISDDSKLLGHVASITENTPRHHCSSSLGHRQAKGLPKQADFHHPSLLLSVERKKV
jgi:hypothetical protein